MASAATLCVITHCGGLANSDGGTDASSEASDAAVALCTTGAFGAVTPIAELNTSADERGLRFTPDEILAVFSRAPKSDASGWKPLDLYRTTRPARSAGLSSPERIMFLAYDTMQLPAVYPSVTGDALSLFFESYCVTEHDPAVYSPLCLAQRDSGATDFAGMKPMLVDIETQQRMGPFGGGTAIGDGFVTRDAGAYYFVSQVTADGGLYARTADPDATPLGQSVFVIYPAHPAEPPPNAFGTPPLRVATDATLIIDNPVLTEDELTMFVSTTTANDPIAHVQFATRTSPTDAFGPLTPLHELDSAEGEYPSWISPDRCRLYLTRTVGGQSDLYVASRAP